MPGGSVDLGPHGPIGQFWFGCRPDLPPRHRQQKRQLVWEALRGTDGESWWYKETAFQPVKDFVHELAKSFGQGKDKAKIIGYTARFYRMLMVVDFSTVVTDEQRKLLDEYVLPLCARWLRHDDPWVGSCTGLTLASTAKFSTGEKLNNCIVGSLPKTVQLPLFDVDYYQMCWDFLLPELQELCETQPPECLLDETPKRLVRDYLIDSRQLPNSVPQAHSAEQAKKDYGGQMSKAELATIQKNTAFYVGFQDVMHQQQMQEVPYEELQKQTIEKELRVSAEVDQEEAVLAEKKEAARAANAEVKDQAAKVKASKELQRALALRRHNTGFLQRVSENNLKAEDAFARRQEILQRYSLNKEWDPQQALQELGGIDPKQADAFARQQDAALPLGGPSKRRHIMKSGQGFDQDSAPLHL